MKTYGTVWIREQFTVVVPWHRFSAEWQPDPQAEVERFRAERGPGWNDAEDAVAWGRQRAPIVYVRLGEGWRDCYNAGERDGRAYDELHDDEAWTRRWPEAPRSPAAIRKSEYAGIVYVGEEFPLFTATGRFSATWASANNDPLNHQSDFESIDAAIEWARDRASIVTIAEASEFASSFPTYKIRSIPEGEPPTQT